MQSASLHPERRSLIRSRAAVDIWKERWETGIEENPYRGIARLKAFILLGDEDFEVALAHLSPSFKHLWGWLNAFREPFGEGALSKLQSKSETGGASVRRLETSAGWLDYETGYGQVTRDKLIQALEQYESSVGRYEEQVPTVVASGGPS